MFQMFGSRGIGESWREKVGDKRQDLTTSSRVSDMPSTIHSVQHGLSQDRSAFCRVRDRRSVQKYWRVWHRTGNYEMIHHFPSLDDKLD